MTQATLTYHRTETRHGQVHESSHGYSYKSTKKLQQSEFFKHKMQLMLESWMAHPFGVVVKAYLKVNVIAHVFQIPPLCRIVWTSWWLVVKGDICRELFRIVVRKKSF